MLSLSSWGLVCNFWGKWSNNNRVDVFYSCTEILLAKNATKRVYIFVTLLKATNNPWRIWENVLFTFHAIYMVYFHIQRRSLFLWGLSAPANYSSSVAIALCGIKFHFHMQRLLWCINIRWHSTWRFCLYRTWWWAALPARRRPTSEPRCDTGREWFLLQTQSWFGGARGIFSLCACCCSLGKISTRTAIIKCF